MLSSITTAKWPVLLMLSSTVQYCCCQLAYIEDAEENFNCHEVYIADTEHYCSITKRQILHKRRHITVANCVYCRC
jgi:hypothetical protein